jgi:endonuclease/exonuclease/phosphatase family metal-dependent hydrolase
MVKVNRLSILSFNMHKGKTLTRRSSMKAIREALHRELPDIVFLQEVVGGKTRRLSKRVDITVPQHSYIAEGGWPHSIYCENAVYPSGHHGNALLSQFPVIEHGNTDVSAYSFEKRGIISSRIELPDGRSLYCFCLHFALLRKGRREQLRRLVSLVKATVPEDAPVVIAGDFNDWRKDGSPVLWEGLHVREVFRELTGKHARSFPRRFPVFSLDRIYFRGLILDHASVISLPGSDHRALKACFTF